MESDDLRAFYGAEIPVAAFFLEQYPAASAEYPTRPFNCCAATNGYTGVGFGF